MVTNTSAGYWHDPDTSIQQMVISVKTYTALWLAEELLCLKITLCCIKDPLNCIFWLSLQKEFLCLYCFDVLYCHHHSYTMIKGKSYPRFLRYECLNVTCLLASGGPSSLHSANYLLLPPLCVPDHVSIIDKTLLIIKTFIMKNNIDTQNTEI